MKSYRKSFPFTAIVGQNELKVAYLANIVNPDIGGLLISGPKGTGKSSIVHSISDILPEFEVVKDCAFNCSPRTGASLCTLCCETLAERGALPKTTRKMIVVPLPLSCTEDRLIGTIDVEKLLKSGEKVIQPGILGVANNNILYIDEVNLLPDHIVDDILDVAASHWNAIEREGVSCLHPSRFILVGTMNPEEGELRPQILDRFPLCVKLKSVTDIDSRKEIIKRNILFENNPDILFEQFQKESEMYAQLILEARSLLKSVEFPDFFLTVIAGACSSLKVDGQRPDIVILKTAITIAALEKRNEVISADVFLAAELTLCHRTRDGGLLPPATSEEIKKAFADMLASIKSQEMAAPDKGTMYGVRAAKSEDSLTQKKNP